MRIQFVLEDRPDPGAAPILQGVFQALERRGFDVRAEAFERMLVRPELLTAESDLYVLHSHSAMALSVAGVLRSQQVQIVNPIPSCWWTLDRIVATQRLRAAGIRTPRTWATTNPAFVQSLLNEGPLVAKGLRVSDSVQPRLVRRIDDVEPLWDGPIPVLFQERLGGAVDSFRACVVGGEVFLNRVSSHSDKLLPCRASYEIYDLAHLCGQALALCMYSVDIVGTAEGFVVTDVDYIPDYRGVSSARSVADCIERYYHRFFSGEFPPRPAARTLPSLGRRGGDRRTSGCLR